MQEKQQARTLVKKLATVMKEVKNVEKRGWNDFHKYHYATDSDVSEKVRESLSNQNVIMLPDIVEHSVRDAKKGHIATVKIKFTFYDGDSGESLSIHGLGEGQDTGDKAVYKAITGAQKYALMKAFMIPTGDDPEADRKNGQNQNQQQYGNSSQSGHGQNQNNRNQQQSRQQGNQQSRKNNGGKNQQRSQNQQSQRTVTFGMLKAKFISVGGENDQFDGWYETQVQKGLTHEQMETTIDKRFNQKKGA